MAGSYDSRSIKAFADALCGLTQNQVRVVVGGGTASTDGRIIRLPGAGAWGEDDFEAVCGARSEVLQRRSRRCG